MRIYVSLINHEHGFHKSAPEHLLKLNFHYRMIFAERKFLFGQAEEQIPKLLVNLASAIDADLRIID